MLDCSIISIYNKKEVINKYLKTSLDKQINVKYEEIFVDNSQGKYLCAKEAIQSVIDELNGKYIIICHQDIEFKSKDSLKNIIDTLDNISEFGVVGVAGVNKKQIISNISHGINKMPVTSNTINKESLCETLDECLFIIKNETKYINEFKKIICNTWHLYAVEYCLRMRILNEKVYVIPADIYHVSSGDSFNNSYYEQLRIITKKYHKEIKSINTTMGFWNTNKLILEWQILITKLRRLKKKLVKLWKK